MILDLFRGPGGWDEGLRLLGVTDAHGIDNDDRAHATALAAGHKGELADITTLDPRGYLGERITGQISSAPCPGFSRAGKGVGRKDLELLLAAVEELGRGVDPASVLGMVRAWQNDERSALTLEPLHWALTLRPRWVTLEQVLPVLPVWRACATVLRLHGYNVWTGPVYAEQYGVPQTRARGALLASLDHEVGRPEPTHSRYHIREPQRLDAGLAPWVSWGEALGHDELRPEWLSSTTMRNAPIRPSTSPAPTVAFGNDAASFVFHHGLTSVREAKRAGSARRITVPEAAILQTFPEDYPFQGSRSQQYLQVSNAVPPVTGGTPARLTGRRGTVGQS